MATEGGRDEEREGRGFRDSGCRSECVCVCVCVFVCVCGGGDGVVFADSESEGGVKERGCGFRVYGVCGKESTQE